MFTHPPDYADEARYGSYDLEKQRQRHSEVRAEDAEYDDDIPF